MKNISLVVVLVVAVGFAAAEIKNVGWWRNAVFYQIYPRSFKDSNDDGIGDLKGITSKLQHFKDTGIAAVWLSPINKSPNRDFGYDISDFKDIQPEFGTLNDIESLLKEAHKLGLKVILDLVPNHTSNQHEWFKQSEIKNGIYTDYYIWNDGTKSSDNTPIAPNQWISVFNGTAWTFHEGRKQFYFHQFYPEQPDLNYRNPKVQEEMKEIMKFWLDNGIDGFRIDAVPHLFESANLTLEEPSLNLPGLNETHHANYNHTLTKDQPETYDLIVSWREFVDEYARINNRDEIVLLTEAYTSLPNTIKYYNGSNVPFNFKFITDVNANSTASKFRDLINDWISRMPNNSVANWVMGNHDRVRVGSRYPNREDQMIMLEMFLPGIAVTYYGEEIGMVDNSNVNMSDFRNPCRTPFQWDNTTNAGFNGGHTPWLDVHENYKTLNLQQQKKDEFSHYKLYTGLIEMRNSSLLKTGNVSVRAIGNEILVVLRENSSDTAALLINLSKDNVVVELPALATRSLNKVVLASLASGFKSGTGPFRVRLEGKRFPQRRRDSLHAKVRGEGDSFFRVRHSEGSPSWGPSIYDGEIPDCAKPPHMAWPQPPTTYDTHCLANSSNYNANSVFQNGPF
ncbi:Maltase 1 [Eufriesea mexicana]|uniref:alpha-glucosidase n=1 Tax=Eufriesea mexicana TaxID=516756 RepID=A0A310SGT7_9HYME|nr:Maltase 1 [Eufriesea mexicana]